MYVDPGAAEVYLWFHLFMAAAVFFMWLYDMPHDDIVKRNDFGDDFTKPVDDDGWPEWK